MSNVVRVKFGTKNAIKGPFELVNGTDYNLFLPNGRMIGKLIKDHKTGVFYMEVEGRRARLPVVDRFMGYMTVRHTIEGGQFGLIEEDFVQLKAVA
jgi:hypothetical protein